MNDTIYIDECSGRVVPLAIYRDAYQRALSILSLLDDACKHTPSQMFALNESSAMIRVQNILDMNEEMEARSALGSHRELTPMNIDGVPCRLVPVEYGDGKLVCVPFRAVRPTFGYHVTRNVEVDGMPAQKRVDFGLVEKHCGVRYDPMPSKRIIIHLKTSEATGEMQ